MYVSLIFVCRDIAGIQSTCGRWKMSLTCWSIKCEWTGLISEYLWLSDWCFIFRHVVSFAQMRSVLFLQISGHVQRPAVGRGALHPSWAAGFSAVRGADRAERPHAVLWRSHRGRSGFCPLFTERQQLSAWLSPLPWKPGIGLPQYPADKIKYWHFKTII